MTRPWVSELILQPMAPTSGKHEVWNGEPGGARTRDHRIKSAMLYQLSYRPDGEGKR
jgi:hypothetical protein